MIEDSVDRERIGVLAAPPVQSPPRILVAEDDGAMRQLVVQALQKDGYVVSEVSDGGRLLVTLARQVAREHALSLDLLISDLRMPICTGMQILEQLRAANIQIPIVLMTAFGDQATRERARSLGAVFIDKPFPLIELRASVARLLRRGP